MLVWLVASPGWGWAQTTESESSAPSGVFDWNELDAVPLGGGLRRWIVDTADGKGARVHCHASTLPAGGESGPSSHRDAEIIILKEGRLEVTIDDETQTAKAGAVLYFAVGSTTKVRNVGDGPATYYVVYWQSESH